MATKKKTTDINDSTEVDVIDEGSEQAVWNVLDFMAGGIRRPKRLK